MVVRWLLAYRGRGVYSIADCFKFELETNTNEVAAEQLQNGTSTIPNPTWGLVVSNKAVIKKFNGDCCSEYDQSGALIAGRNPRASKATYKEVWCLPQYVAVAVKSHATKAQKKLARAVAVSYGLPVVEVSNA